LIGTNRTEEQKLVDDLMAKSRIVVEWEFGRVAGLFAYLKYKPGQKLQLSRVGMFYVVATLMKNIHTCVNRRNETSEYFGIDPPFLTDYIREISHHD
jgi:hypothetical protein